MEFILPIVSIFFWILPILIIVLIVRAIMHRGQHDGKKGRQATFRDLLLAVVGLAAWFAGATAIYFLPVAIFGDNADNEIFAARLCAGVALLGAGLMLRHVTGITLMITGITGFLLAFPFIFENLGSAGALVVVAIAFCVLVGFAVKMSRRTESHG